jgi:hypothetical protein
LTLLRRTHGVWNAVKQAIAPYVQTMSRNGRLDNERRAAPLLPAPALDVYIALDDLAQEFGQAPTFAQILERLGWSPNSKGTLHRYIEQLRGHGLISGRGRGLRVLR